MESEFAESRQSQALGAFARVIAIIVVIATFGMMSILIIFLKFIIQLFIAKLGFIVVLLLILAFIVKIARITDTSLSFLLKMLKSSY